MGQITNTAKLDPLLNLFTAAGDGGIEAQEARGQSELVASSRLPSKSNTYASELRIMNLEVPIEKTTAQVIYEALGCTVIGVVAGDPLFMDVTLPEGWKLDGTGHSMWSNLLDEKGRTRGSIFYKAAFYDRDAHFSLNRRYNYTTYVDSDAEGNPVELPEGEEAKYRATYITDFGTNMHLIGVAPAGSEHYAAREELGAKAKEYLNETFPEWENPLAYWDAE